MAASFRKGHNGDRQERDRNLDAKLAERSVVTILVILAIANAALVAHCIGHTIRRR